jgi:hypothetical protein
MRGGEGDSEETDLGPAWRTVGKGRGDATHVADCLTWAVDAALTGNTHQDTGSEASAVATNRGTVTAKFLAAAMQAHDAR